MSGTFNEIMTYITSNFPQLLSAGTIGFLLSQLISHFLAKSRSKEDFQRAIHHKNSETENIILSHLGVFTNGILHCWEEGTVYASKPKFGPLDMPMGPSNKIEFKEYAHLKQELVKLGVFPAKVWHSLDKLPNEIDKINKSIETKIRSEAFIECCHFSEMCKSLWGIVASEYASRGGNISELTPPMPFSIPHE
ncbi:hypothetical protein [Sedimenticola hydrogenitrophicus]|uniref:hypothetical protein n=1 Tax=Sedimenticola hydrogenitrophicus TaxID=2967975 RepID=UPI0023B0EE26|nr:hypothetical protein [Sedimenticola hydrogenitrophicus]